MAASSAPPVVTLAGLHGRMAQVKPLLLPWACRSPHLTPVSHITTLDDSADCAPPSPHMATRTSSRSRQDLHVQPGEVLVVIVRPNPQPAVRVTGRDVRPRRQKLGAGHGGGVTTVHKAASRRGRSGGIHEQRAMIAVATAAVAYAGLLFTRCPLLIVMMASGGGARRPSSSTPPSSEGRAPSPPPPLPSPCLFLLLCVASFPRRRPCRSRIRRCFRPP